MPVIRQAIVARGAATPDQDAFERKVLVIRKQTQNPLQDLARKVGMPDITEFYMPSFSARTVVYKGLLLAHQVGTFYRDLRDPLTESPWRSCTSGSPPTPSRRGSWPTPIGSSPTTARSIRCGATSTG